MWKSYAAILWLGDQGHGTRTFLDKIAKSFVWSTQASQVGTFHCNLHEAITSCQVGGVVPSLMEKLTVCCYLIRKLRCSVYHCIEHWIQLTKSLPEEGGVVAKLIWHLLDDVKPLVSQTKVIRTTCLSPFQLNVFFPFLKPYGMWQFPLFSIFSSFKLLPTSSGGNQQLSKKVF